MESSTGDLSTFSTVLRYFQLCPGFAYQRDDNVKSDPRRRDGVRFTSTNSYVHFSFLVLVPRSFHFLRGDLVRDSAVYYPVSIVPDEKRSRVRDREFLGLGCTCLTTIRGACALIMHVCRFPRLLARGRRGRGRRRRRIRTVEQRAPGNSVLLSRSHRETNFQRDCSLP